MEREELEYYEKVGAMIAGALTVMEKNAFNFKDAFKAINKKSVKEIGKGFWESVKSAPKAVGKFYKEPAESLSREFKGKLTQGPVGDIYHKHNLRHIGSAFGKATGVYGGTAAAIGGTGYLLKRKSNNG